MNQNLYNRIEEVLQTKAEQTCIRTRRRNWTYRQLQDQVRRTAGALKSIGIGPGDRILAQGGKCPEALALYLACLQLGAIYVPLNTTYTAKEVQYFIGDTEPSLFVSTGSPQSSQPSSLPIWTIDDEGQGTLFEQVSDARPWLEIAVVREDDVAAILYTSGTTGRSKGAMLTHRNLISNADTLIEYWDWQSNDVLLHVLPTYHVHGLFVAIHCVLLTGTEMIWHETFDVERVLCDLPDCTVLMGVPTHYMRLLNHTEFDMEVATNMRLFISGSAPLSEQTFQLFEERTGFRILERYGMSETLMNTSNPICGPRVAGTVGFPLPGIDLRIADDDSNVLRRGEIGHIELRGPNVFLGYWRMPDQTAHDFSEDGFFKTGDMGFQDQKGRVSIVGREKDVIISGGLNVYPAEVETVIEEMEAVVECAVIGAPHPDFGEGVVAVVVSTREISIDDLDSFLKERLARFKQPKVLFELESLPRNAMGKIQKNILRKRYSDSFSGPKT